MYYFADCGGAQTNLISCSDGQDGVTHIICLVISIAMAAVGILAVLGITVAGIQYLSARDNEEQVRKAKRRILHIVIGLLVYALMWPLVNFLMPGGLFSCSGQVETPNNQAHGGGTSGSTGNSRNTSGASSDSFERPASEILY